MKGLAEQPLANFESVARPADITRVWATSQKTPHSHRRPQRPYVLSMARLGTAQAHRRDRPKADFRSDDGQWQHLEHPHSSLPRATKYLGGNGSMVEHRLAQYTHRAQALTLCLQSGRPLSFRRQPWKCAEASHLERLSRPPWLAIRLQGSVLANHACLPTTGKIRCGVPTSGIRSGRAEPPS